MCTHATAHVGADGGADSPRACAKRGRNSNWRPALIRTTPRHGPASDWGEEDADLGQHDPGLSRQDLPQAIADVERAIALEPLRASSWRVLSLTIEAGRTPEAAVGAAERAVELGPGDPDNWVALASAFHHAGRNEAAIEAFEKAISWSPLRPPQYVHVGARLRYSVQDMRECAALCPRMHGSNTSDGLLQGDLAVVTHLAPAASPRPKRRGPL